MIRVALISKDESTFEASFLRKVSEKTQAFSFEVVSKISKEYDFLFSDSLTSQQIDGFETLSHDVRRFQYWDNADQINGNLVPQSSMTQALKSLIVKNHVSLNNRLPAFVIGSNGLTIQVIDALIKFGFSNFYILAKKPELLVSIKETVLESHFGVQINIVETRNLNSFSGTGSFLAITEKFEDSDILLANASYFNYLKKNALAVSFLDATPPPFFKEAVAVGQKVISFSEFYPHLFRASTLGLNIQKKFPADEFENLTSV